MWAFNAVSSYSRSFASVLVGLEAIERYYGLTVKYEYFLVGYPQGINESRYRTCKHDEI